MADKKMEAQISVEFDEATSRQSLNSGETINTLWGKVKRWLSDLKAVAFSGSYNDLSDTPTTATTDTDGLMSAEDKVKLNGIATGANKTIVDTALSSTSTNPVQNKIVTSALAEKALKSKYGDTTINVGRKADTVIGERSTAEGYNTTASGNDSHSEGYGTTASGWDSHSEGCSTTADGMHSHAEGFSSYKITSLIPDFSHNTSNSDIITAWNEKNFSLAKGVASHVENADCLALGRYSHAEGRCNITIGDYSHAEGYYTIANNIAESACGSYNKSNDDTLFSVGDGTINSARHNAFEITTTGGKLHDKDIATTETLSGYLPLTGGMTTGTTGLAGNFRVYVGDFTRVQFLLNGAWATVISGDNTNNGIIVGTLGLNKAAFNVDDPSHAYVNSYPIYSAGYKPFATGSFGKSSGAVTIDCGFKPSYVVIFSDTPSTYIYSTGVSIVFTLNNTGFVVSADIPSGKYSYIALR